MIRTLLLAMCILPPVLFIGWMWVAFGLILFAQESGWLTVIVFWGWVFSCLLYWLLYGGEHPVSRVYTSSDRYDSRFQRY